MMIEHIKGLHHIGIPTNAVDRTIGFYKDLGAKVVHEKTVEENGKSIRVVLIDFAGLLLEFYHRDETAGFSGAIDHLAFEVSNIEELYKLCKQAGHRLMSDCAEELGTSSYWPETMNWFIVYGPNEEKVEFSQV